MLYHGNRVLLLFSILVSFFLLSCGGEEISSLECITVADCPDDFLCVDGLCIEGEENPEVDTFQDDISDQNGDDTTDVESADDSSDDDLSGQDEESDMDEIVEIDEDEVVDDDEIVLIDEDVETQDLASDEDEVVLIDEDEVVDDENECLVANGGCDQICTDLVDGYKCSCNDYYAEDGDACTFCDSEDECGASCTACGGATPWCKTSGATTDCVRCLNDDHCTGSDVCNTTNNTCESGCPAGWLEEYNRCFYFSSDTKTYDAAQSYCESQGGNLVTIENGTVDAYVVDNTDERTWIGIDGRAGAYKVAVSGVPDYLSPQSTGDFGGRYHGNNSDSGLFRSAEVYTIVPGKTGFYDITVVPTAWDPQIRVFSSPTEASLGASAVAHAWSEVSGITEQLTVELTGGETYYVATTHCDGCFGGEYDMFISYSGVEDTNYQKHGWPTDSLYNYENWYNTNPNENPDYCVFMYPGDEWDENTCGNLYNYVCDKTLL